VTFVHRRPPARGVLPVWRSLAAVALLALVLTSCSRGQDPDQAADQPKVESSYLNAQVTDGIPHEGGTLVYGVNADTNSWNPAQAQWGSYSFLVARTMFDFLTEFDEDGDIKLYAAESLVPNADFTLWTIKLRDGIKFSNGQPLTAADVVRNHRFIKASPIVSESFRFADTWEVKDRLTFVVNSSKHFATLPQALLSQVGAIAWPDWLESGDWEHPVGTGPFQMDTWKLKDKLVVKRNPYYWRKDSRGITYPYLDKIEFRVITDEATRVAELRNGNLDIMLQTFASPTIAALRQVAADGRLQLFTDERFETAEDHVVFNTKLAPFDDIDARRALAYATDEADYVKTITAGLNQVATSAIAPGSAWYTPTDYPAYDPVKARELVEKVKARHNGKFEFELLVQNTPEAARVEQYLADAWAKVGATVIPRTLDNTAKIVMTVAGLHQAALMQLFDSPSVTNDGVFWSGSGKTMSEYTLNFSRLDEPDLRGFFDEANATSDMNVRHLKIGQMQKRLAELVPYVWLSHVSRTVVASTEVMNVVHHTLPDGSTGLDFMQGSHATYQIWLKA
jgi:peptide/nickel transport system substrate-binding protein